MASRPYSSGNSLGHGEHPAVISKRRVKSSKRAIIAFEVTLALEGVEVAIQEMQQTLEDLLDVFVEPSGSRIDIYLGHKKADKKHGHLAVDTYTNSLESKRAWGRSRHHRKVSHSYA